MIKVFKISLLLLVLPLGAAEFLNCGKTGLAIWPRRPGQESTEKIDGAVRIHWGEKFPSGMYLAPPEAAIPQLKKFGQAVFVLKVRPGKSMPSVITMQFRDAGGEMFQYNMLQPDASGQPGRYVCALDSSGKPATSWGPKRTGKIEWPLKFVSFGIAVRHLKTGGSLEIESLDCRIENEEGIGQESGGFFIGTPANENEFMVELRNFGKTFPAEITFQSKESGKEARVSLALPENAICPVKVPESLCGQGLNRIDWSVKSTETGCEFKGVKLFSCFPATSDFFIHRLYWGKNLKFNDVSYQLDKFSLAFGERLALQQVAMARNKGILEGDTLLVPYSVDGKNRILVRKARGIFLRDSFPPGEWRGVTVKLKDADNNILKDSKRPVIEMENRTGNPVKLTGKLTVTESMTGKRKTIPVSWDISPDHKFDYPLPGEYGKYGMWYINFDVSDPAVPVAALNHTMRIARIPEKPWSKEFSNGFIFGVNASLEGSDWADQMPLMKLGGIKMVRGGLSPGSAYLKQHGLETLAGVFPERPSADWPEKNTLDELPESLKKFAANAENTARKNRGIQRYFMMKNEADISARDYPEDYLVLMQRVANRAFKKGNPECKLLSVSFGSLLTQRPWNLNSFWDNNPRVNPNLLQKLSKEHQYDYFAYHGHEAWNHYIGFVDEMKKNGFIGRERPWFAEETARSSRGAGRIQEMAQADTLIRKVIYSWANDAVGYIWYDMRNDGNDALHNEQNFGLLTHSLYPKPAFMAYSEVIRKLTDSSFIKRLEMPVNTMAFLFQRNGQYIAVLWNDATSNRERLLFFSGVSGKVKQTDMYGNEQEVKSENGVIVLKLTDHPVYLTMDESNAGFRFAGELLTFQELAVTPGEQSNLTFTLHNTIPDPLTVSLMAVLPEGLTGKGELNITLNPNSTRKWSFPVTAAADYNSQPDLPEYIELQVGGKFSENIRVPVFSTLTVDESWNKPLFRLDQFEHVDSFVLSSLETSPLFWSGPEDISSSFYCRREQDFLHLKFVVTDDIHFQQHRGGTIWLDDTAQVAFKLPGDGNYWEFWFALHNDGDVQRWCWNAPPGVDKKAAAESVQLTVKRDENTKTTTYDARIPMATLGLDPEICRTGFRINVMHTDNDGSGRESHLRYTDGMGIDDKDYTNFPFIRFAGKPQTITK